MIKRYSACELDKIVEILNNDGVVSVPTDTVYGLCAKINSFKAYDKLVMCKNRPRNKCFPVMCLDLKQIKDIAEVDEKVEKIINKFMPGPITLILNKKNNLDDYITNGGNTIAVRMATSKELEYIINKVGSPLFMTSANQSSKPTCKNLDDIEINCPLLDGILVGDVCFGEESTIVDCSKDKIEIIRSGPVSLDEIMNVLYKEKLLSNLNKIHTTEMGLSRIKNNLKLDGDVVKFCIDKIFNDDIVVYKRGKNYYCEVDNMRITINSYSYTIITAYFIKKNNI